MEERANRGFLVTTSGFARTALDYECVKSNLIELINGKTLAHMMLRAFPDSTDSEKYKVMCMECGCKVTFDLSLGETQKLSANHHLVMNDLRSEMLSLKLVSGKEYCDRCGGEMRRVSGRHGDFRGCTRYPTCRFTRPITAEGGAGSATRRPWCRSLSR
jgi:Topoisomerase DNA binding C4 zinc finger/Restriction endonuclease